MGKHTQDPWEAAARGDYTDFGGNSRVILGGDRRIAVVQHRGDDEDEANAYLIAAAPDLAEALKAFVEWYNNVDHYEGPPINDIEDRAEHALRKAGVME